MCSPSRCFPFLVPTCHDDREELSVTCSPSDFFRSALGATDVDGNDNEQRQPMVNLKNRAIAPLLTSVNSCISDIQEDLSSRHLS